MAKFASLDSLRAIRDWAKEKFQSKLPEVTTQDNGDVLSVVDGEWAKAAPEKELPSVDSADNGKVLEVVEGEWAKATPQDELPEVSASDNGKFLGVVNGAWGKADVDALPAVTSQDNGKVMMVENGAWGAGEVDVLPTVTAQDNGKVLGVVEGQWAKTEPEDGLPSVTSSDNGKVLSVVEGAWAPAEPTVGSGLPEVTSEDNGDLLSVVDGAWTKSEPGYRVENSETVIAAEQSVTTAAQGPYIFGQLTATFPDPLPDSVNVTFNGTSYANVPQHADASLGGIPVYGDSGFEEYPFVIAGGAEKAFLVTQAAGTYTIAITVQVTTVTPDNNFKAAVKASGAGQAPLVVNFQYDTSAATTDKTFNEILAAWNAGQSIVFNCENYPKPGPDGYLVAAPAVIYDNNGDIGFQANYTYVATLDSTVYTIIMSINSMYTVCYYSHT